LTTSVESYKRESRRNIFNTTHEPFSKSEERVCRQAGKQSQTLPTMWIASSYGTYALGEKHEKHQDSRTTARRLYLEEEQGWGPNAPIQEVEAGPAFVLLPNSASLLLSSCFSPRTKGSFAAVLGLGGP
jgi:hypothetical protein